MLNIYGRPIQMLCITKLPEINVERATLSAMQLYASTRDIGATIFK